VHTNHCDTWHNLYSMSRSRGQQPVSCGLGQHFISPGKPRDKKKMTVRVRPPGNDTKQQRLLEKLHLLLVKQSRARTSTPQPMILSNSKTFRCRWRSLWLWMRLDGTRNLILYHQNRRNLRKPADESCQIRRPPGFILHGKISFLHLSIHSYLIRLFQLAMW
jgi:hypothetical protein